MNIDIEQFLKDIFEQEVSKKIDEEIYKKVEKFREELTCNKDKYLAEIMRAIRINVEQMGNFPKYQITFENIYSKEDK